MIGSSRTVAALVAALSMPPVAATAQTAEPTDGEARVEAGGVRALGVAKWSALGATVAAAGYGLAASLAADERYDRIERLCEADARRCEGRDADGAYLDPELHRLDQEASRLDERARLGLIAGQVGVAASVVLFILDLRDTGSPPNVPYHPSPLRIGPSRDGGIRLSVRLPAP